MSRLDARGNQIGGVYQERCIESWRRAGLEPVSVNSIDEPYYHPVRMIPVGRHASGLTGRSQVFLADLLAVASAEAHGGPFVLMNADLLIPRGARLAAKVRELSRGEFMFGRRIDIDRPTETRGTPYRPGYDFFAGHADDISLPENDMVFGAPWWDHLLPLLMFTEGVRIYQPEPVVLHLRHEERWSWTAWTKLGELFIAEVESRVRDRTYRSRLDDAKQRPSNAPDGARRMLQRVTQANVSFLDEVARSNSVRMNRCAR